MPQQPKQLRKPRSKQAQPYLPLPAPHTPRGSARAHPADKQRDHSCAHQTEPALKWYQGCSQ